MSILKKIIFLSLFFRRYTQESNPYYYPHEKYYGQGPTPELPGWDNNSSTSDGEHAIPVHLFPKHVSELHLDQVCTVIKFLSKKVQVIQKSWEILMLILVSTRHRDVFK